MRVLHVIPSYLPARRYGGVVFATHGLCAALARAGCEVAVYTTSVDGAQDAPVPLGEAVPMDGVSVWYFRSSMFRRLCYAPGMTRELERRCADFDLLHLHSVFLWPTWAAARTAHRAGVPYVVSPRGMLVGSLIERRSVFAKRAWLALVGRRMLQRSAAIHATSALEARELARLGFALPPVIEVPNGVGPGSDGAGTTRLPAALSGALGAGRPVVLYVGRVNWKKGLDRVIEAISLVPAVVLLIVGNDEEGGTPDLEALAARLGLRERVVFAGPVYGSAKMELYQRATLCVLASDSENFGNVVLEAMREGCPVVVTPEVGAAEIVRRADAGLVVSGDAESLARAFVKLVAESSLRAAMGRRARDAVAREYGWDAIATRMLAAYKTCLAGDRVGTSRARSNA
jgi:glycosyltransferase involved in cell wall biosynthesis